MGRYWALSALSVALRGISVLLFVGYIAFWVAQLFVFGQGSSIALQTIPTSQQFTPQMAADFGWLFHQTFYFLAAIILIFLVVGWPLTSLFLYAAAQWIDLHISMEFNTRRVADSANAAQRRRQKMVPANPEDIRFWDEQIAAQRNNAPAPKPNLTPPSQPIRGESTYRIQFNQDPKPRERRRLQSSEEPTSGDTYSYGRPGKRENE